MGQCLSIKSIFLKYHVAILKPPLRLPTHVMERRVKILETFPKSEQLEAFMRLFLCICRVLLYSDYIKQKCLGYETFNLNLACQHI